VIQRSACLIDVYQTILSCDFSRHGATALGISAGTTIVRSLPEVEAMLRA
jgi:hypothetical protein